MLARTGLAATKTTSVQSSLSAGPVYLRRRLRPRRSRTWERSARLQLEFLTFGDVGCGCCWPLRAGAHGQNTDTPVAASRPRLRADAPSVPWRTRRGRRPPARPNRRIKGGSNLYDSSGALPLPSTPQLAGVHSGVPAAHGGGQVSPDAGVRCGDARERDLIGAALGSVGAEAGLSPTRAVSLAARATASVRVRHGKADGLPLWTRELLDA